tara:strand:+ start:3007 stop:3288 length:282 start_codon:yes stop_codon:yes gene_type:complete
MNHIKKITLKKDRKDRGNMDIFTHLPLDIQICVSQHHMKNFIEEGRRDHKSKLNYVNQELEYIFDFWDDYYCDVGKRLFCLIRSLHRVDYEAG